MPEMAGDDMEIKRIKKLRVNSYIFNVIWDNESKSGSFDYGMKEIRIGVSNKDNLNLLVTISHELFEIAAVELNIRLNRPDCDSDYVFVFDHRQYSTVMEVFIGLLSQFIK